MDIKPNTVIESLGTYLPPKTVSSGEILEGCDQKLRFPLEKITGIKTRHMAGEEEFAIDLAKKAVADCLRKSKYTPADIDLLICCNISRTDGLEILSYEPCTSIKIRKQFGFENAMVFDITNACAGMFTGIYIVDTLLRTGVIQRGMVVSGEYITHLTQTAQREIESYMDSRLACLTLGDAGAALILETGPDKRVGFQKIELQTFGRYSPLCIGKASETSGWIMYTDSVNLTDVGIKTGAKYALDVLKKAAWPPDSFDHLIMHQTSRMSLNSAMQEINQLVKSKMVHEGNTINNLEERGNTASTSHFIALADQVRNQRIQSGDRIVFNVSASGLTVGTALYVLDDLPDRLRQTGSAASSETVASSASTTRSDLARIRIPGIRIESVGTIPSGFTETKDSLEMLHLAATNCLQKSSYLCNDIELLVFSGVYRNEFLMEPAYAALLAGRLNMNATTSGLEDKKTFAFDIFNGAIGFLNACYIAQQMIAAGNCGTAMIAASEIENNDGLFPDNLVGVRETASAIILDAHPVQGKGFTRFLFNYPVDSLDAYATYCVASKTDRIVHIEKDPDLDEKYIACILPVVEELLRQEGLELNQMDKIFPPQISSGFIARLSGRLAFPLERFVEVPGDGADLFSSSLPYGFERAFEDGLVKPGDTGLVIAVGSGIQVGCAIYHF